MSKNSKMNNSETEWEQTRKLKTVRDLIPLAKKYGLWLWETQNNYWMRPELFELYLDRGPGESGIFCNLSKSPSDYQLEKPEEWIQQLEDEIAEKKELLKNIKIGVKQWKKERKKK